MKDVNLNFFFYFESSYTILQNKKMPRFELSKKKKNSKHLNKPIKILFSLKH